MRVSIELPTLHAGQLDIFLNRTKRNALRCGRRFGKTKLAVTLGCDTGIYGGKVGIFAPEHKQLQEPYDEILSTLAPLITSSNKTDGVIKLNTGGKIDFWRLIDNELAGRGREYDRVIIDEAAFTKSPQMLDIWRKSILPTMATRPNAEVWVLSTPNGDNPDNFFYKVCRDPEYGFTEFAAPSIANPMVDKEWLETERLRNHPDVYRQEFLAEFVDWTGTAFFDEQKLLVDGVAPEFPTKCHLVFAVIDSALKEGREHDGTGVVYFAQSNFPVGPRLYILDWDIIQIEGALLESWLPTVGENLEAFARQVGAIHGSIGSLIEDKASGTVLLQQARRRGWAADAINSKITAMGKEERALNVSGYVYRGEIKMTRPAYEKQVVYKGNSRNHLLSQITGFRMGQNRDRAQDDLLDAFCSGIAEALGNSYGF